jgi:hypothetical protein
MSHTHIHTYTHTHIHTYTHANAHAHTHTHTHTHTRDRTCCWTVHGTVVPLESIQVGKYILSQIRIQAHVAEEVSISALCSVALIRKYLHTYLTHKLHVWSKHR